MLTKDDEYHPNTDQNHANGEQDKSSADKRTNVERKPKETKENRYDSVNVVAFIVLVHWWSLWLSTKKATRCDMSEITTGGWWRTLHKTLHRKFTACRLRTGIMAATESERSLKRNRGTPHA